jgi:hypothetical protein
MATLLLWNFDSPALKLVRRVSDISEQHHALVTVFRRGSFIFIQLYVYRIHIFYTKETNCCYILHQLYKH